jgi:membrane fusion protein, multidrug efflux system
MTTETIKTSRKRWRILALLIGGVALVAISYSLYWAQVLRYHQGTDDAYVGGNVVQITPQISGTVIGIGADDTQFVKAGQPLVRLDRADAQVALDQAEAQLARTVRDVRSLFATTSQLDASVQLRRSDLDAAQKDLVRRLQLGSTGAISGEELQHARDAVKSAQASLLAAQQHPRRPPAGT